MLAEQIERMERGEDPRGVIRDAEKYEPMIDIRRARQSLKSFQSRYENAFERHAETTDGSEA